MNDADEIECLAVLGLNTKLIKALTLADFQNASFAQIVSLGEQYSLELRTLYDRLIGLPAHEGAFSFRPWVDSDREIVASTACEAAAMLVRVIYLAILPDQPNLWETPGSWKAAIQKIEDYEKDNAEILSGRFTHLSKSINPSEWLRLVANAELEQVRLGATIKQVEWSQPRSPAAWRKLLKGAGQPYSETQWRRMKTENPDGFDGVRQTRISRELTETWGLDLPEF